MQIDTCAAASCHPRHVGAMWTSRWPAAETAAPYSGIAPPREVAAVLAEDQLMICAQIRLIAAVPAEDKLIVCAQIRLSAAVHQQGTPGGRPLGAVV